jgi:hypothetical protein
MRILHSKKCVDEMVELARVYCSMLATCRLAKAEGRLSAEQETVAQRDLAEIDATLSQLNNRPNRTVRTKIPALKIVAPRLHTQRRNHDRQQHSA